ncbi:MAG: type I restriction endonuclease subunit R [Proteobacteria bacterium]|nr:type I restriction endonuclease subunit R [Pseudomonadota bacterium]
MENSGNQSLIVNDIPPALPESGAYQSEEKLEHEFIKLLQSQGIEYLPSCDAVGLQLNLRKQLSRLNNFTFNQQQWSELFHHFIACPKEGIIAKTIKIQEDSTYQLTIEENGCQYRKNIHIIDKNNIHLNHVQVVNQFKSNKPSGDWEHRYDVTILVNGFPMVHVELKRRGVHLKEAFRQIDRYKRESFHKDGGLFEYTQIFVISNGTQTKYYSNTVRDDHVKEGLVADGSSKRNTNSYQFTHWWTNASSDRISDLMDFTRRFFQKSNLLMILTRFCVFTVDKQLLVMRPYQIAATERIIQTIEMSKANQVLGTKEAGGYIWHSTGSGKTLTSFKTAKIASDLPGVDKVIFIVDRKDLDHQTMAEYDKFEKGSTNASTSTAHFKKNLEDPCSRIIITTIHKMSIFIKKTSSHPIFNQHVVMIFDECHRSQFGDMHKKIKKAFKKYNIFGFTGTPIFAANANKAAILEQTTEDLFGPRLHRYNIVDAIRHGNVLPFKVDFISTTRHKGKGDRDMKASDWLAPDRITSICRYIISHYDQKTRRRKNSISGTNKERSGFNSIFAVSSIAAAKKYYSALTSMTNRLKIAIIFSYVQKTDDGEDDQGAIPDEDFNTKHLDLSSQQFLEQAISDYNRLFHTNFDTTQDKFEYYYHDLSKRVKNGDVDIMIVVNMFLTGFDAKTLNTLWVDKNLRQHGLIQAFSRTNRILNRVKTHGNIVCFRDLEEATNEALAIYGSDQEMQDTVLVKGFEDYFNGYNDDKGDYVKGYKDMVAELPDKLPLSGDFVSEKSEAEAVKHWNKILKQRNLLSYFDEFQENDPMTEQDLQNYQGLYLHLYEKHQERKEFEKELSDEEEEHAPTEHLEFETELIKQIEVNIDYILSLVAKWCKQKMSVTEIQKLATSRMNPHPSLRHKVPLITDFISKITDDTDISKAFNDYVQECQPKELEDLIQQEKLHPEKTKQFMASALRDDDIPFTGVRFADILPPISMFSQDNEREQEKSRISDHLNTYYQKFQGLGSSKDFWDESQPSDSVEDDPAA